MINGRKIVALCISRIHDVSSYEFTVSLNEKLSDKATACSFTTPAPTLKSSLQTTQDRLLFLNIWISMLSTL
ncbi:MAG: hypothetical protein IKK42_06440 [Oscillospiraceae bacterium]|nr:hypothetical protein [Oscillospiraceae bacterium]